jgi:hypothetical protein
MFRHAETPGADNELTVIAYEPDPAGRRTVGEVLLTPDAYVDQGVSAPKLKYSFWLEIDRENAKTIKGKCQSRSLIAATGGRSG